MTSRDFCYWLQGFFEISGNTSLNFNQVVTIKNHLNLVFKHEIDPSIDGGVLAKQQELAAIHNGGKSDFAFEDIQLRC